MLKHLKRVFIAFTPGDPRAVSARELLQRVSSERAKRSNPACKVEFEISEEGQHGQAYVDLHFVDDEKRKLPTADRRVDDIASLIDEKGTEMEMRGIMKEVGFDPWKKENRLASNQQ